MSTSAASVRASARRTTGRLAGKGKTFAKRTKAQAKEEISSFYDDIDDLLKHVADVSDAEVARVRARVESALHDARATLEEGGAAVLDNGRQLSKATDGFVRERAWTVAGAAIAVGLWLGIQAARR